MDRACVGPVGWVGVVTKAVTEGQQFLAMDPKAELKFPTFLLVMKHQQDVLAKTGVHFWMDCKEDVLEKFGFSGEGLAEYQISLLAEKVQYETQRDGDLTLTFGANFAGNLEMLHPTAQVEAVTVMAIVAPKECTHLDLDDLEPIVTLLSKKEKGVKVTSVFHDFALGRKLIASFTQHVSTLRDRQSIVGVLVSTFAELNDVLDVYMDQVDIQVPHETFLKILTPFLDRLAKMEHGALIGLFSPEHTESVMKVMRLTLPPDMLTPRDSAAAKGLLHLLRKFGDKPFIGPQAEGAEAETSRIGEIGKVYKRVCDSVQELRALRDLKPTESLEENCNSLKKLRQFCQGVGFAGLEEISQPLIAHACAQIRALADLETSKEILDEVNTNLSRLLDRLVQYVEVMVGHPITDKDPLTTVNVQDVEVRRRAANLDVTGIQTLTEEISKVAHASSSNLSADRAFYIHKVLITTQMVCKMALERIGASQDALSIESKTVDVIKHLHDLLNEFKEFSNSGRFDKTFQTQPNALFPEPDGLDFRIDGCLTYTKVHITGWAFIEAVCKQWVTIAEQVPSSSKL